MPEWPILSWRNLGGIVSRQFRCGYCGRDTGNDRGYVVDNDERAHIYVCPSCSAPSFFWTDKQWPGATYGNEVDHLPRDVEDLYREARACLSVSAYTPAVLACRKILMHIAVERSAKENEPFAYYVQYLADNHFLPPDGARWVDHIRQRSNEANHDIVLMTKDDAERLIGFTEMLLKFVYELPNSLPADL